MVEWFVRQSSFSGLAPEKFFEAAAGRERDRRVGAPPVRQSSDSPLLPECSSTLCLRFSLFLPRSFPLSCFRLPVRPATTRHMDAHEERLLHRARKRPRKSSSRFASLVKRTRDFAYRTPSRFSLLSSFVSPSTFVPSSVASATSLFPSFRRDSTSFVRS